MKVQVGGRKRKAGKDFCTLLFKIPAEQNKVLRFQFSRILPNRPEDWQRSRFLQRPYWLFKRLVTVALFLRHDLQNLLLVDSKNGRVVIGDLALLSGSGRLRLAECPLDFQGS